MIRLKNLLNETEIQTLREISNLDYDLQDWYDHWNQELFDGELEPVPLRYSNSKDLGKTKAYTRKKGKNVVDVESIEWLAISKMYEMPEEIFHATLIHEMIHVYMLQNHEDFTWKGGYHGVEFKNLARKLSEKSGYDIATFHDFYEDRLDVRGEGNETIVVVIYEGNEPLVWGLQPSAWTEENKEIVYGFLDRQKDWEVIRTSSPEVKKITRSRKVPKQLKFTPLSQETVKKFRQSGEVLAND